MLADEEPRVRVAAITALGNLGVDDELVVPALLNTLAGDEVASVRSAAIKALESFKMDPALALPVLLKAVNDEAYDVPAAAIDAIGRCGPAARHLGPELIAVIRDNRHYGAHRAAMLALPRIGLEPEEILPVAIYGLKSSNDELTTAAATVLSEVKVDADEMLPVLSDVLKSPIMGQDARVAAARAIRQPWPGRGTGCSRPRRHFGQLERRRCTNCRCRRAKRNRAEREGRLRELLAMLDKPAVKDAARKAIGVIDPNGAVPPSA